MHNWCLHLSVGGFGTEITGYPSCGGKSCGFLGLVIFFVCPGILAGFSPCLAWGSKRNPFVERGHLNLKENINDSMFSQNFSTKTNDTNNRVYHDNLKSKQLKSFPAGGEIQPSPG